MMRSASCYCACLALILSLSQTATADPIRYSTSGQFELSSGTVALTGVSDLETSSGLFLGTIPLRGGETSGHLPTPFHVRFEFDGGLPSIEVSGVIGWVGYNSNEFIENPVVTTSATTAEVERYPAIFQDMLFHPDWIRTMSYASDTPTTAITMAVAPYDPHEIKTVPEPSMAMVFATGLIGVAGWARHRRGRVGRA